MSRQVAVAGLYGMSLLLHMQSFPGAGETVGGELIALEAGGKGFNQAVSAARNGVNTTFITAVGDDDFGQKIAAECQRYGFSYRGAALRGVKTAAAAVMSDAEGESRVVVAQGACAKAAPQDFDFSALPQDGILLLQNELPEPVNIAAAKAIKEKNGLVILNPAPARALDKALLKLVDFIVPNWGEALSLTGLPGTASPAEAAQALHAMGVPNVMLTLGGKGVFTSFCGGQPVFIPAEKVTAVDTSGAGDTFCGAFAARIAKADTPAAAARFANAAGGLSVTRKGIMQAIPYEEEITRFLSARQS